MDRRWITVMSLSGIINFLMPVSMAIDPNCDFYQDLQLGQEYYIYNSDYPNNYTGQQSCRWAARSPPNTKIVLSCEEILLPPSYRCQNDRLVISVTGDASLNNGHSYCGSGSLTRLSESNTLSVGLWAPRNTVGGRFVCTLTAIIVGPPATTSTPEPITCNCGWKNTGTRIVGGVDTLVNEYPSMAGLINLQQRDGVFCGANIISERYALTAAHCLVNLQPSGIALLAGDHNYTSGTDTNAAALYAVIQFKIHESYSTITDLNDIAIIQTQDRIRYSLQVGPICLPFRYSYDTFYDETITALGWGLLEFSGTPSDTLQKVNLTIVENAVCSRAIDNKPITENQVCTFGRDKDTCLGDSGGPLLWQEPNSKSLQQIGIISYGGVCGSDAPAVNTRVTAYLTWIISKTTDAVYCIK